MGAQGGRVSRVDTTGGWHRHGCRGLCGTQLICLLGLQVSDKYKCLDALACNSIINRMTERISVGSFFKQLFDNLAIRSVCGYSRSFAVILLLTSKQEQDNAANSDLVAAEPKKIDLAAAMRGFFAIVDAWGVAMEEARALLGSPAERTFYAWRAANGVRVP